MKQATFNSSISSKKYSLEIAEYPDDGLLLFSDGPTVYAAEWAHVRRIDDGSGRVLFSLPDRPHSGHSPISNCFALSDGMVIGAREPRQQLFWLEGARPVVSQDPDQGPKFFSGAGCLLVGRREATVFCYDRRTDEHRNADLTRNARDVVTDGVDVCVRIFSPQCIVMLDAQLRERWRYAYDRECHPWVNNAPRLTGDLVLVLEGRGPVVKTDFKITALRNSDGSVAWTKILPTSLFNTTLCEGRLAMVAGDRLYVLDVETGATLVDRPTGFELDATVLVQPVSALATPDAIVVFHQHDKTIRIFSADGTDILQDILLPMPPGPHAAWRFQPNVASLPIWRGGKVYCLLDQETGCGAVAVLTPTDGEPTITIKPRLPFRLEHVPDGEGGRSYRLSIAHDDLDQLVAALRYELRELCMYCGQFGGNYRQPHDHADPLFNGRVVVAVDAKQLPDQAKQELEAGLIETESFLREYMCVVAPYQPPSAEPKAKSKKKRGGTLKRNRIRLELELT